MKRVALAVIITFLSLLPTLPVQARGDGILLGVGIGGGLACCGYYPYYSPYYAGYQPYYAPPPTVVYTQPSVVYAAPPPVTYIAPPQTIAASQPAPVGATQSCRQFQTTINGAPVNGTACLQSDGTWHVVGN